MNQYYVIFNVLMEKALDCKLEVHVHFDCMNNIIVSTITGLGIAMSGQLRTVPRILHFWRCMCSAQEARPTLNDGKTWTLKYGKIDNTRIRFFD